MLNLQVEEIPGKVLVAIDKETGKEVAEAHRVKVESAARSAWVATEGKSVVGIFPSWDTTAAHFKSKGHKVVAIDSEERSFAPRSRKPRTN